MATELPVIQCTGACTVQIELVIPPLNLTPAEGAQIGMAICLVWAVGWGIRQLIIFLRSSSGVSNENQEN